MPGTPSTFARSCGSRSCANDSTVFPCSRPIHRGNREHPPTPSWLLITRRRIGTGVVRSWATEAPTTGEGCPRPVHTRQPTRPRDPVRWAARANGMGISFCAGSDRLCSDRWGRSENLRATNPRWTPRLRPRNPLHDERRKWNNLPTAVVSEDDAIHQQQRRDRTLHRYKDQLLRGLRGGQWVPPETDDSARGDGRFADCGVPLAKVIDGDWNRITWRSRRAPKRDRTCIERTQ